MVTMFPLKPLLSQHGFSSEESYDHAVRCFLSNPINSIRCLNIDGDCGRRRTAFANALANALGAEHVLYYEFGKDKPIPQIIRIQEGEEVIEEPPVDAFDRMLTEACAQSEADETILILDQLHKTQFLNHIRLYEFLKTGLWRYSDVQYQANVQNLKVFLISDEELYHSLQALSFRLWVDGAHEVSARISATDLGIDASSCPWLSPLQQLFEHLKLSPTMDEYKRLIYDIEQQIRSEHQLKVSLYGWIEGVQWELLQDDKIKPFLEDILHEIQLGLEIHEEIEISGV